MKLLFASDIHGSVSATSTLLEQFANASADWLILLGDLLYHGPRNALPDHYQPARVAELLNQHAKQIIAVKGNCDSDVDQMLLHFPIMAEWQQLIDKQRRFFLTHGHHYNISNLPPLNINDVFIYGHTHIPQIDYQQQVHLFNPGSVSLPKGNHPTTFGRLIDDQLQLCRLSDGAIISSLTLYQ